MAGHEKLSTAKAELARVSEAPAGKTAPETARGGEFKRMMEGLRETERELSVLYLGAVTDGRMGRSVELDRMRDAVLRAIEELRSRHE